MTDDYQLRKELDNYKWLFDELTKELERQGVVDISGLLDRFYDQSEVDVQYTTFSNHLSEFNTRLTTLLNSLKDFNGALIDFSEDNENLEDDLTKLKDNLLEFLDVLGLLDIDLIQLKGQLDTLELQMNGDAHTTGFVDFIQELQNNIYGANETYTDNQGNTQHYTINYPSPNSLKGTLQSFGTQLGSLSAGDTKLALTLSSVTGYLTNFKGTLAELQAQIVEDYGQSFYDGLDEEIVKLIGAITNANDEIDNHQGLIEGVQVTIGEEGDENTPSTGLFAKLDNVSETADGAVATSDALMDTLYKKAILHSYDGVSYGSTGLVVTTTNNITTFSTRNDTYGTFAFSSTTSLSSAYYVTNGQGFEFTIVGHTGKTNVRFYKSDGTLTNLFNSDTDSDYFENNNYIKIIHTGTSAEVYVNNYLMKTVTLSDANRLVIRVENGGTFSFKDLHQISVTGTDDNPANGSVINGLNIVKDTDIPAVKNKMGYNDIPNNTTLQSQLDTHDEQIGDVPTGKSLQGQIGTVPNGKTIQGQIGTVPSGTSLQGQIGTVDVVNDGTLQDQLTAQSGIIGGDSDIGSDGTLFGLINKSIADIGDEEEGTGVLGDAKRLKDLSYGYSDGGTISNPSSDSIMGQTTTLVEESIPTLQEDIYGGEGYSISSPSSSSLQGQINNIKENAPYIYEFELYKVTTDQFNPYVNYYEKFSQENVKWGDILFFVLTVKQNNEVVREYLDNIEVTVTPTTGDITTFTSTSNDDSTNMWFVHDNSGTGRGMELKNENNEVVGYANYSYVGYFGINGTGLYKISCDYIEITFNIADWIKRDLWYEKYYADGQIYMSGNEPQSYTWLLYVNPAIRLCKLRYYRAGYSVVEGTQTIEEEVIPSEYYGGESIVGSTYNPNQGVSITKAEGSNTKPYLSLWSLNSGSRALNFQFMWNY